MLGRDHVGRIRQLEGLSTRAPFGALALLLFRLARLRFFGIYRVSRGLFLLLYRNFLVAKTLDLGNFFWGAKLNIFHFFQCLQTIEETVAIRQDVKLLRHFVSIEGNIGRIKHEIQDFGPVATTLGKAFQLGLDFLMQLFVGFRHLELGQLFVTRERRGESYSLFGEFKALAVRGGCDNVLVALEFLPGDTLPRLGLFSHPNTIRKFRIRQGLPVAMKGKQKSLERRFVVLAHYKGRAGHILGDTRFVVHDLVQASSSAAGTLCLRGQSNSTFDFWLAQFLWARHTVLFDQSMLSNLARDNFGPIRQRSNAKPPVLLQTLAIMRTDRGYGMVAAGETADALIQPCEFEWMISTPARFLLWG
jgi:hypothetical protein